MGTGGIMTLWYAIHAFLSTCRRLLIFTGSARVACAAVVRDRFLLSGRSLYVYFNVIYLILTQHIPLC
jgi:hypothetical protein